MVRVNVWAAHRNQIQYYIQIIDGRTPAGFNE
jgi:hypothetical protein